jgi:hypothetical protein
MKPKLLLLTLVLSFVFACTKPEESASNSTKPVTELLIEKWQVPTTANSPVRWIEFLKGGQYLVAKTNNTFYAGKYTLSSDNKTVNLAGMGTLSITNIATNSLSFTLQLNGSASRTSATATGTVNRNPSNNTDLLCNTWSVYKEVGFEDLGPFSQYDTTNIPGPNLISVVATISNNGTYFVTRIEANPPNQNDTIYSARYWQWKDPAETVICYGDFSAVCNGINEAKVLLLNQTLLNTLEVSNNNRDSSWAYTRRL